jgi:hypothetical protein
MLWTWVKQEGVNEQMQSFYPAFDWTIDVKLTAY